MTPDSKDNGGDRLICASFQMYVLFKKNAPIKMDNLKSISSIKGNCGVYAVVCDVVSERTKYMLSVIL